MRAIKLGSCVVTTPIMALLEDERGPGDGLPGYAGTIGANILQQFNTVFDYRHQYVVFRRNSNPDGPFEYDMTGLHVLASGPEFHDLTIDQVMPNSPAQRNGIRVGDRIESVNRIPASQLTVDRLTTLSSASGVMHLTLRRDGKLLKSTLKLQPLI